MRTLGWDPGRRWVGWALLDVPERGPAVHLRSGMLDLQESDLFAAGSPLLTMREDGVLHVAVEQVRQVVERDGFSISMAAELARAERVGGLIVGAARILGMQWSEPSAPAWRQSLCGQRQASDALIKTIMEARVHGLPARTNPHQRDAMGVAIYAGIGAQLCIRKERLRSLT